MSRSGSGRMGAPGWSKKTRPHLELLLPLPTSSLMLSYHKHGTKTGSCSHGLCSLQRNAQGVGRQRPSCNPLACIPPGPRSCPTAWPAESQCGSPGCPRHSECRGSSGRALGRGLRGFFTLKDHEGQGDEQVLVTRVSWQSSLCGCS